MRTIRLTAIAALLLLSVALSSTTHAQTPLDPLTSLDVAMAAQHGIDLTTSHDIVSLTPEISMLAADLSKIDGFTGLQLNWSPVPSLTVAMTAFGSTEAQAIISGFNIESRIHVDLRIVRHSQAELQQLQTTLLGSLVAMKLPTSVGLRADLASNEVVVEVPAVAHDAVAAATQLVDSLVAVGQPVAIELEPGAGDALTTTLDGGSSLSSGCTAGFTLKSGASRAILTAGHCGDAAVQQGVTLGTATNDTCPSPPLGGQQVDRQIHSIPAPNTATNLILVTGRPARAITSVISNAGFFNGQAVEKQGVTTGYTAGNVVDVTYQTTLCGGLINMVRATNISDFGDSGGPEFNGQVAYGITAGKSINNWVVFSRIASAAQLGTSYTVCVTTNCS